MDIRYNFIKKTISALLIFTLLIPCVPVCTVHAAQTNIETASADTSGDMYSDKSGYSKYRTEAGLIAAEIDKYDSYIDVSSFNIPAEDSVLLLQTVLYTHPELYYIDPLRIRYTQSGGIMQDFIPVYLYHQAEREEMDRKLAESTAKMLYGIDDSYTDVQKALIIHDRLALGCQYSLNISTDTPDIYTVYGCLVNGTAVCQGYALSYNYLMRHLGIEAEFVSSSEMQHAWSMIKLGNQYYHVDVTWDDPIHDKGGQVYHSFFLKSDSAMKKGNSQTNHYGWISKYKAEDTAYDHFFWENINTQILLENGAYYYIDNLSQDASKGNLVRYDGIKKTVLDTIDAKWYVGNTGMYYVNNFSYLFCFGEYLYYNTSNCVYRIRLDGGGKAVFYERPEEIKQDIYGMYVSGDGYLYLDYGDTPNQKQTRVKTIKIYDPDAVFPSFDAFIPGDANGDGKVDVTDATAVQLYVADSLQFTDEQMRAADVTNDGKVDILDATQIQIICANRI